MAKPMSILRQKKREDNYLCYIPRRQHKQWEIRDGKVLLLFEHDKLIEKFARWLVKKPYSSDLELDEIGSQVWSYIDDRSTVFEIGQKLQTDFGAEFDPRYQRLISYLNYLNKKGWILFRRSPQMEEG
ncbi:PqqD family protein [Desulfosporosinus sp. PR]|uniref:PqqD family protein n=1 Tax=Candidatus Desulfosporosinus nitrosoreducens TaxID=3401928 RepID=UPI0027FFB1AA|nr:PqqD family protein [Desulfosporosinus sp. PR]MDQ7094613.1 PqqD family protein [Desulfosporosinus sp. PR]